MKLYRIFKLMCIGLVILAWINSGCGGGDGEGETTSGQNTPTASTAYDMDELAVELTASMGEDAALEAVILAFDKGYSIRQVADAAMLGRLETNGDIIDGSGSIVYPEDIPPSLIDKSINAAMVKGIEEKYDLEGIKIRCKAVADKVGSTNSDVQGVAFIIIFALIDRGYSPEQVFSAMFFGNIRLVTVDSDNYPRLDNGDKELQIFDDQGNRVIPAQSPRGIFSPFMITLQGATSLVLKDGNPATGTWNVSFTRGSCPRYWIFYYWGDGDVTDEYDTLSATHAYKQEGTYQLRAHLICNDETNKGEGAYTNTLLVEVKDDAIQAACPEGTWDVRYDLNCGGNIVKDEIWVFHSDMTWEKTVFSSCGWEGDWYLLGNDLSLASNVLGCWYTGQVNDDCTAITGDGYFEEWHDCWTATRRP
jgi:hypothetical protein